MEHEQGVHSTTMSMDGLVCNEADCDLNKDGEQDDEHDTEC